MITRMQRILTISLLTIAISATSSHSAEVDWIGPNLLSNPGFEIAGMQGLPVDWTVTAIPAGTAKFSLDRQVFLTGKTALKAEVRGYRRRRACLKARPSRGRQVVLGVRRVSHDGLRRARQVQRRGLLCGRHLG